MHHATLQRIEAQLIALPKRPRRHKGHAIGRRVILLVRAVTVCLSGIADGVGDEVAHVAHGGGGVGEVEEGSGEGEKTVLFPLKPGRR